MPAHSLVIDWDSLEAHLRGGGKMGDWAAARGLRANSISKRIGDDAGIKARMAAARAGTSTVDPEDAPRVHLPDDGDDGHAAGPALPSKAESLEPDDDYVIEFLREKRVNLKTWVPVRVTIKRYMQAIGEGKVVEMPYLHVDLKRRAGMVLLNVVPAPKPRKVRPLRPRKGEPEVTVLMSCDHAPYHDEAAHTVVCGLIERLQPNRCVYLGDLFDGAFESRHEQNMNRNASIADGAVVAYRILAERIGASLATTWELLEGNHDARLRQYIVGKAGAEYARLAPVGESLPLLSIPRLIHLDELGVTYHGDDIGKWDHAEVELAPELIAIHGLETTKTGAAAKTATDLGVSVICGHTHRQRITPVTTYFNRQPVRREAMEVGSLCRRDLGYAKKTDWQQGVGVLFVWPDGSHDVELARIDSGVLRWRGERLTA